MKYAFKPVIVLAWEEHHGNGWGDLFGVFDALEEAAAATVKHLEEPGLRCDNCADIVDLRSGKAISLRRDISHVLRGDGDDLVQARQELDARIRQKLASTQGPEFHPGCRIARKGEPHNGRVQSVGYDARVAKFRYVVKWDVGPTTSHLEDELVYVAPPERYQ